MCSNYMTWSYFHFDSRHTPRINPPDLGVHSIDIWHHLEDIMKWQSHDSAHGRRGCRKSSGHGCWNWWNLLMCSHCSRPWGYSVCTGRQWLVHPCCWMYTLLASYPYLFVCVYVYGCMWDLLFPPSWMHAETGQGWIGVGAARPLSCSGENLISVCGWW